MPGKKTAVTRSVDDDVLKWFEAQGAEFGASHQFGVANLRRSALGIAPDGHLNQTNRLAGTASNLSLKFDWAYDTCGKES
jgi:hypothetical protein